MPAQTWINNLSITISSALAAASGVSTVSAPSGTAAALLAAGLSASKPAVMVLTQPSAPESSWEVVAITAAVVGTPDTLTITRAYETSATVTAGGTGLAWAIGSKMEMRATSGGLTKLASAMADSGNVFRGFNLGGPAYKEPPGTRLRRAFSSAQGPNGNFATAGVQ